MLGHLMEASIEMINEIVTIKDEDGSRTYPELWSSAIVEVTKHAYEDTLGQDYNFQPYANDQRFILGPYLNRLFDGFSEAGNLYSGSNTQHRQLISELPKRIALAYNNSSFPVPLLTSRWIADEHSRWVGVDDGVNEVCQP